MKLTGQKNQCQGCKQYFNSNFAFEKHRVGDFASNNVVGTRRCLSESEMKGKGWVRYENGFWVTSVMPKIDFEEPCGFQGGGHD